MPDWQPNWADVVFDFGAAATAADTCDSTAGVVRAAITERRALVDTATQGWLGPAEVAFARQAATLADQGTGLEQALRVLSARIRAAAAAARVEQADRDAARAEWNRQALAEATAPVPGAGSTTVMARH